MALCVNCGKELNDATGRRGPADWFGKSGYIHYCLECQQKYWSALAALAGKTMATFYCCVAFNAPVNLKALEVVEAKTKVGGWIEYLSALSPLGADTGESPKSFFDGLWDITAVFGIKLSGREFLEAAQIEKRGAKTGPGTEKQRDRWGAGDKGSPYEAEDYEELDRIYRALSSDIVSSGGLNSKQEFILQNCARWTLEMQKYIDLGETGKAKQLNDMIQTNLASENLRKKDERPLENFRIDDVVERFQAAGLMKDGMILPLKGVQQQLAKYMTRKKYAYTLDAADQMLLAVINDSRANDGLPEYGTLPQNLRFSDTGEFSDEPNEDEKEAYRNLGLVRTAPSKGEDEGIG